MVLSGRGGRGGGGVPTGSGVGRNGRGGGNRGSATLTLQRFKIDKMRVDGNIGIIGKRRSGKTNFARYLLQFVCCQRNGLGKLAAVSKTEKYNHAMEKDFSVDPDFVRSELDVDFIRRLLIMQKELFTWLSPAEKKNRRNWLGIIFDDCAHDKAAMKLEELSEIMYTGAHFGVIAIQLVQDGLKLERDMRECYDYICTLRLGSKMAQNHIGYNYYGMFNKGEFAPTMVKYTSNRGVLIADNTNAEDSAEAQYFWDRAPNLDDENVSFPLDYSSSEPYRKFLNAPDEVLSRKEYHIRYAGEEDEIKFPEMFIVARRMREEFQDEVRTGRRRVGHNILSAMSASMNNHPRSSIQHAVDYTSVSSKKNRENEKKYRDKGGTGSSSSRKRKSSRKGSSKSSSSSLHQKEEKKDRARRRIDRELKRRGVQHASFLHKLDRSPTASIIPPTLSTTHQLYPPTGYHPPHSHPQQPPPVNVIAPKILGSKLSYGATDSLMFQPYNSDLQHPMFYPIAPL